MITSIYLFIYEVYTFCDIAIWKGDCELLRYLTKLRRIIVDLLILTGMHLKNLLATFRM